MKKTVTIIIGNTDNRLSQQDWADFVGRVEKAVHAAEATVEFFGGCSSWARYQNAAWVVVMKSTAINTLKGFLALLASEFHQQSVAVVVGETEFVKAA